MSELYTTSVDILYLVLTIVIGLLGVMLAIAIFRLIRILKDVNHVSTKAKDTIDLVNHYLWQPIKIMMSVIDKIKPKKRRKSE